ncbi:MAG: hypothetical protein ABIN79_04430 [Marmoricola sp.]
MRGRRVDPHMFMGVGALIDWAAVAKTQVLGKAESPDAVAERRKLSSTTSVQLRWAFKASMGYPRTPFTVWVRDRPREPKKISWKPTSGLYGAAILLDGAYAEVFVQLEVGPGGVALAFSGMPFAAPIVASAAVDPGTTTVRLTGPGMRVVTVPAGSQVTGVYGSLAVQDDPSWRELEIVGLPGDGRTANATDLRAEQGMVDALTDPESAAYDRFRRGAPFYGWPDEVVAGVPAPTWSLADPSAIVQLFWKEMLEDFITMVDAGTSADQALMEFQRTIITPTGEAAKATFNPLTLLLYGGATDPLDALVTGFGTAYPWEGRLRDEEFRANVAMVINRGSADYMVTATFLDPLGGEQEWAALILNPGLPLPVPAPADLVAKVQGVSSPDSLDRPYRPVVNISWDAPTNLLPFHVGSLAPARRTTSPAGPVMALLQKRPGDSALQPIGASQSLIQPLRRSTSDATYPIDATVVPNAVRYSVAAQSIFGLWSAWSETGCEVSEPPVSSVPLTACRLDTQVQAGPCPATLTCDVSWTWSARSPQRLEIVGRRFAQTWAQDMPGPAAPPTADTMVAAGEGVLATLWFGLDGDITAVTHGTGLSATAQHLSLDGLSIVPGPLGGRGTRRYRVSVSNLMLDFDTAGRWGLALWARGVEQRLPHRVGNFGSQPVVVSAADPRPPVLTAVHEDVVLASMRDADGMHHADLRWPGLLGASSYRVYTCAESTLLSFHSRPQPRPDQSLAARLVVLRQLFADHPDRRPFTRVGAAPLPGTSTQVTLPRGTKDIHLYLVLGVSVGEVESEWPSAADPSRGKRPWAFAAPQVVAPAAPQLEVTRVEGPGGVGYAAGVRIVNPRGAPVQRVELHRVRVPEAAITLDTMGPPVAAISGSGGGYAVSPTPVVVPDPGAAPDPAMAGQAQSLGRVVGIDPVPGSWKPVIYRAVAWGSGDATKGQYPGRSEPSVPRQVVVPPAGGPELSGPTYSLPTAGSANALISTATTAPVNTTLLGDHRLEAEVLLVSGAVRTPVPLLVDGGNASVASWTLASLPTSAPTAPSSGLYRDVTSGAATAVHLLVRRPDATASLAVRLRLTDPLGRMTEKLIDVPPGAAGSLPPDIVLPTVTKVIGGWILTFKTSVPNSTADGPFMLDVRFSPKPPPRKRATQLSMELAKLPGPPKGGGMFDAPLNQQFVIPVSRSKRVHGSTSIGVGLRKPGTVVVSIVAPDGTKATITRQVGGP